MSAAPSKMHGSPDYFWVKVLSISVTVFAFACIAFSAVIALWAVGAWGAAQQIPPPLSVKQGLGSWRAVLANDGTTPYGSITRGRKGAGGVGQICASCTMPSPAELADEQWMDLHLMYQTANPIAVAEAELVCDPGYVPTIVSVHTLSARVGLWLGRVRLACAHW